MSIPIFSLQTFVWTITVLLLSGAALPKLPGMRRDRSWTISLGLISVASLYAMALGAQHLWTESQLTHEIWWRSTGTPLGLPPLRFELGLDALAAFFLLLTGFFALIVAVYSLGALRASHYHTYRAYIAGAYSLFVWGTLMTVVAYDVFLLLLALEISTLAFTMLTLFKMNVYRRGELSGDALQTREARLAPKVYLIISHASTAFLLLGFLLLAASADSASFLVLQEKASAGLQNQLAFWFLLAGLGIRAGLSPAHIWPPLVHPASPTTTHAFSLGMGIKVALFLMIRVFFQFLHPAPWWGLIIFLLASATALINVWYALASHDLKTALAYHSIENIGIMVAGIGLAIYASAHAPESPLASLAGFALIAGLFHLLNHAIFKSLLYLATGSIENLTRGQVHMARLGGVLRFFPWIGTFFLIGAWAISGFPPFNGFISEWLTLKANLAIFATYAIQTPRNVTLWRELFLLLMGFMLLVASFALTGYCFFKIAGLTLMGGAKERPGHWGEEKEISGWMHIPMGILALAALLIGIFPRPIISLLARIVTTLGMNPSAPSPPEASAQLMPHLISFAPIKDVRLQIMLAGAAIGMLFFLLWFTARGRRKMQVWEGGIRELAEERTHPTAASLTWLIRKQFRYLTPPLFDKRATSSHHYPPDYLPDIFLLAESPTPQARQVVIELFRHGFNHLIQWTFSLSERFALSVQNGDVRRYMSYIAATYLGTLILYMIFLSILASQ